jgi:hypothetical protein
VLLTATLHNHNDVMVAWAIAAGLASSVTDIDGS